MGGIQMNPSRAVQGDGAMARNQLLLQVSRWRSVGPTTFPLFSACILSSESLTPLELSNVPHGAGIRTRYCRGMLL
jgi:hypothetical protein